MTAPPLSISAWLRYGLIRRAIRRMRDVHRVLEVGCGQGAMGARLERRFSYLGLEPDAASFRTARARIGTAGGEVLPIAERELPTDRVFDLLCAFEVLEHIDDDEAALRAWSSRIRTGGYVLLSVPAHQARFGPMDERVGHFRRYEAKGLAGLLRAAGFRDVDIRVYGFPLGYALEAVRNRLANGRPVSSRPEATAGSGRLLQPRGWMGPLVWAGALPFRLLQEPFTRSDLGTGYVVSARRSR